MCSVEYLVYVLEGGLGNTERGFRGVYGVVLGNTLGEG